MLYSRGDTSDKSSIYKLAVFIHMVSLIGLNLYGKTARLNTPLGKATGMFNINVDGMRGFYFITSYILFSAFFSTVSN